MMANDHEDNIDITEKEYDEMFLDLIQERPCLYDKSSKDYYDTILNENAMEEIAFIINDTVENCESKWKKFLAAYTKEKLLLEKESRSGAPASNRKPWIHFKRMHSFMSPKEITRSSYTNIAKEAADENTKNPFIPKSKKKNVNPMEPLLLNVQDAISEVKALKKDYLVHETPELVQDNLEEMIGNIIKIQLNKLSPKLAKKKRKLIMKCLIDEDSDSESSL